jgi:DNA polymerase-3 subunit epsilon
MYIIIDFETTGLDYNVEQVTEIAAIRTDEDLNVVDSFQTYVKLEGGRTLSDFIKNLTGFTDEFLEENGISQDVALQSLKDFIYAEGLAEPTIVAHHAPFDFSFMKKHITPVRFICTRVLSRLVEPNEKASLADVAKRLGISNEGHHKAANDIEVTRQILKRYKPVAEANTLNYRNVVIDSSERPLNFIPANSSVIQLP